MVLRGQYLERPALIACGDVTLEGLYHRGDRRPSLLVCPPLAEGGMDSPVAAELAWACARAGHPSLRFQHRGVGASTGAQDPSRALEDAEAALRHLAESAPGRAAVAGIGDGCETAAALARAHPEVERLVLVAPPRAPALGGLAARLLAIVPGAGPRPAFEAGVVVAAIDEADGRFLAGLPRVGSLATGFLAR
ncbi:MAG TPA: alpha/beta hydrolase [Anaeromyxobacteraceae bacterium]|jgi:alpha/beta superfamily hydrolase